MRQNTEKRLVLFGAVNSFDDHRKGGDLLVEALLKLSQKISNNDQMPDIVIFGGSVVPNDIARVFNCHLVGILNEEEELAAIYNACDVFVAPSREEALANTVLESTACGTPTVAFNIGGMPDSIVHKKTGYLANPYSIEDMAKGIDFCLNSHGKMTNDCVNLSEKSFSLKKNVYELHKCQHTAQRPKTKLFYLLEVS